MGSVTIRFCCTCGKRTENLTQYWQWTDFSKRSSEAIKEEDKLELCGACLDFAKKEFQERRKHTLPPKPDSQALLF